MMIKQNEVLIESTTGALVITREFNAPRELVFQAFTQAKHLINWWGPKGSQVKVIKLDLRPEGEFHYSMAYPDGPEMYGKFVYLEIQAPERIVFVNSFADATATIIRPPFTDNWPLEIKNTWTFTEENGRTTITLIGQPINASPEEQQTFAQNHESMRQGFGGTFDQLTSYLTTLIK